MTTPARPAVMLPPPGDASRFINVDGLRIHCRVQGQVPALVLVHGLASSHLTWDASIDALAEHFTVYALDLPGFGYSDKPAGYASGRRVAACMDRCLSSLGLERVTLVGHSLGGAVALWLAAEHPERVERLVLVNVAEIGESAVIFRLIALPIVGDLLLKMSSPAAMRLLMASAYVHKDVVTPRLAATYAGFLRTPGARQALIELARTYDADRAELRPRLGQIGVPALIVWTDRDPYFRLAVARDLLAALPLASLQVIPDCGHLPQEEQPVHFSQIVLDWLEQPVGNDARYLRPAAGATSVRSRLSLG